MRSLFQGDASPGVPPDVSPPPAAIGGAAHNSSAFYGSLSGDAWDMSRIGALSG